MSYLPFHLFCPQVLNLHLTSGQNVVAKVAFGNMDPSDLEGDERALALEMFGGVVSVPRAAKKYICLRLGRGSGKTTICSAYAVHQSVTADISRCGPGDVPYVIVVAPDKATAQLSIRMSREMMRGNAALNRLVVAEDSTSITIRRPEGRLVKIEAFAATRGGSSMRGRTIICFIMDEAEFFTSNGDGQADYSVNDRDIFQALKPRLLPAGKGMLISTPWPAETLMGKMFTDNWSNPISAVSIKATTLQVRGDDPAVQEMVADELEKDPENARRELFCELDGWGSGDFFDTNALNLSLVDMEEFPVPRNQLWPCAVGADMGFTRDSSAQAVVQFDGRYYPTVFLDEVRPKAGHPLKPSTVISRFAKTTKAYGEYGLIADGYYRESVKEELEKHNLVLIDAPSGASGKAEVFQRTRSMLHEGLIIIPKNALGRRLVEQAKLVTSKPSPGGTTTIKVPRKIGMGHGDLVSAWTLAVHKLAYGQVRVDRVEYEPGTDAWKEEFDRRMLTREQKLWNEYVKRIEKEQGRGLSKRAKGLRFGNVRA